jgi:pristinamycin I synthase-3/4
MNTPSPAGALPDTRRLAVLRLLFGQVLGHPVAEDDDFFAVGGTPAQAGQLARGIRTALGSDISETDVRRAPTPSALAGLLDARRVRPYTRPATVPLSAVQRGLWFLHRLEGPSATYNLPFALRLTGSLDRTALAAALGDIIRRHETLRTVYPETAGVPRQHVLAAEDAVPCLEVTQVAAGALGKALAGVARYRFDLSRQPPLRAELFVTGPQEHTLMLVVHHIAADGWSMGPLVRDLATAYEARLTGARPRFTPLGVQYADHTVRKTAAQGTEEDPDSLVSQHLTYWREALARLPEGLDLPADRLRPAVSSFRGDIVPVRIPSAVHDGLAALARDSGTSLFMVLHAALAQLLTRMTGSTDVALGTVVSGRDADGSADDLVGLFVNTVVLRADTSGDPTFRELVARVTAADLAAFAHQDTAFERIVEELAPGRSSSRQPLINTMLVLQNTPAARLELPGLRAEWEVLSTGASKFDLTFSLAESHTGQGLTGIVEYSTDLFDRATVPALVDRFVTLLGSVAAAPDTPVSSAQVLSARERRQLEEWNATERAVLEQVVPELFEERVAEDPGHVALVHDGGEISYGELNERANRLARLLIERGAGPGDLVALALPRSPELYTALLAVSKAGAAYVPLDIEYPAERLAAMLDDARPLVVVTRTGVAPGLPAGTPLLDLDDEEVQARRAAAPACNPVDAARVRPLTVRHPLYVIYTSGSTGRPKGVVIEHGGVASLRATQAEALGTGPGARVLQFASPSFDASFWEISLSLLSGGVLVLGPGGRELPGPELTELAHRQRITHVHLPPSALAATPPKLRLKRSLQHPARRESQWTSRYRGGGVRTAGPTRAPRVRRSPAARRRGRRNSAATAVIVACRPLCVRSLPAESPSTGTGWFPLSARACAGRGQCRGTRPRPFVNGRAVTVLCVLPAHRRGRVAGTAVRADHAGSGTSRPVPPVGAFGSMKELTTMDGQTLQKAAADCAEELPGAGVEHPFGPEWEVYKVRGKVFMLMTQVTVTGEPVVILKSAPDESAALRQEHEEITPGYHMNKKNWITLEGGSTIDETLVKELVTDSYRLVVGGLAKSQQPVDPHTYGRRD